MTDTETIQRERLVLTPEEQRVLVIFARMLSDIGVQGALALAALYNDKDTYEPKRVTLSSFIRDITDVLDGNTPKNNAYDFVDVAPSLCILRAFIMEALDEEDEELKLFPDDMLPSDELCDRMLVEFQRQLVENVTIQLDTVS